MRDSPATASGCVDTAWPDAVSDCGALAAGGEAALYDGFKFSSRGVGVQWENTGSGLMALVRFAQCVRRARPTPQPPPPPFRGKPPAC